jgi:hypothetical protein
VGSPEEQLAGALVVLVDGARVGPGEPVGAGDDGAEHGLQIERRAERLADLAQRAQLLDRAGELGRALLELAQEPGVLDRDGGLVGEGFHQRDLAVGERPDLMAVDGDGAQQLARAEHRDRHHRAVGIDLLAAIAVLGCAGAGPS